ncbi:transcriptional regulator, DeoR family [Halobacillus dabanensis]|uniref:Transcriptional regulator, DeoR family n=1 Tax=Halobacillus dabanensis TaxID=240302 RepID=A0A1I3S289_HALDA|nr:DeoR/GlpR family DNA-binding transcription regulator [Halobacillus dabanensis]SFJ52470.1 transcriptional regulator, DeoR family [Halobacillus dabanensis]
MKMFASERRNEIMKILQQKQRLTVKEIAEQISTSEATIRADLTKLEMDGLLTRTHGGAILNEGVSNETSFYFREKKHKSEKRKIAVKALELIKNQQCILLDASSTTVELARHLKNIPFQLTVVTNGIQTALELKDNPLITVILIGGIVTKGSTSIEGDLGIQTLDQVNIDLMFTSASGFSIESGLTDFNLYEVELKREMVKRAKEIVALVDHSKINLSSSAVFCLSNQINTFITDQPMDEELYRELKKLNVKIID